MSYENIIEEILRECKTLLGIDEHVKVKVKSYKTRIAFCNLKNKTIYINENLLDLGEDTLRYIILHELLHIKLNSKYHNEMFHKLLHEIIPPQRAKAIRKAIFEKILAKHKR